MEPVFGYDWKSFGRFPKVNEVFKVRNKEDGREDFGLWDGKHYYIFNMASGHWEEFAEDKSGYEYAYVPPEQARFVPYWALANSRRYEIEYTYKNTDREN